MEMNRFHFRDPVFGINNRFGMGKIERDLLYDRHRDDVLREINQLNYGKNNLDLFYKTNFYKNTGSEKIELNGINRLGIGKKKWDAYQRTEPNKGAGIIYDINDEWAVHGGVNYSGGLNDFKNPEKYSPEVGVHYSPKCSIF